MYTVDPNPQGSQGWLDARSRLDLTASRFRTLTGKEPEHCPDQTLALKCMKMGTLAEGPTRRWYAETRGVEVQEVGLCIPVWEPRIGCSPDGLVGSDGIIEIKWTYGLKRKIELYEFVRRSAPLTGGVGVSGYDHIDEYYDQIQGCMKILGRKWCDLIIVPGDKHPRDDTDTVIPRVYRIEYDDKYWTTVLGPAIESYLCRVDGREGSGQNKI